MIDDWRTMNLNFSQNHLAMAQMFARNNTTHTIGTIDVLTLISLDASPDPLSVAYAPKMPVRVCVLLHLGFAESSGLGECLIDERVESGDCSLPDQVVLHSGLVEKVVVVIVNVITIEIVKWWGGC